VVMPTCTVDRKAEGSSLSMTADFAPGNPSSAIRCSRALRDETTAISDMANTAFSMIRRRSRRTSI